MAHRPEEVEVIHDEDQVGLFDLIVVMASHWKLIVFGALGVGVLTAAYMYSVKPVFTARTVILPPQQQQGAAAVAMQSLGALANLAGVSGVKTAGDQYLSLMQSVTISSRVIESFKLQQVYEVPSMQTALVALAANSHFSLGKKDGLITIEVDDTDPQRAADIANDYVIQLRRFTNELAVTEAQQRRVFFEKQLMQAREKLRNAQVELQKGGFDEKSIRTEPKATAESYAALKAQLTAAEVRLRALRTYMTEDAAEVKLAQAALSSLRTQMATSDARMDNSNVGDYVSRYRDFKYYETLFELFARQYELAKVDESRDGALIQVVDAAYAPEKRSRPRRTLTTIAATLSAGFMLMLFVLGRAWWRNAMAAPEGEEMIARLRFALKS